MNGNTAAAPALERRKNTTLLGETAWLMLRIEERRNWRIWDFAQQVAPAIGRQQFRLYYQAGVPIAYVSWAFLSAEAEARFVADPTALRPEDWASGDRAYIVDFVVLRGTLPKIAPLLRRDPLLRTQRIRAIRRRNGACKTIEISPGRHGVPRIAIEPDSSAPSASGREPVGAGAESPADASLVS